MKLKLLLLAPLYIIFFFLFCGFICLIIPFCAMCCLYQSLPRVRFNKEGNLLAVTTADNGFKILANVDGLRTLRIMEARSFEASRASTEMKVIIIPYAHFLNFFFFFLQFVTPMLGNQVSTSAMVTNIGPAIGKMEQMDIGSPARPTPIPVWFTIFRFCFISRLSAIDEYR